MAERLVRKKIRVIHVVLKLNNAGLENVVLNICQNITEPDIEQVVCCLEIEGALVPALRKSGVTVYCMNKKPGLDFFLPFKLARLFRQHKIDVVHSHDAGANLYGGLAGLLARVKRLIKTEHGGVNITSPRLLKFDVWLSNRLQQIVTV